MRSFETSGSMVRDPKQGFVGALKLAAIVLGIGLVMSAGAARAGDDDDDDMTFEEKIIDNIMSGIGARSMQKPGVEYRERSPLVVPPKLDLPPPASTAEATAPNWTKDPDEKRRKEAAAARKKGSKAMTLQEAARPLSPSELNAHRTAAATPKTNDPIQPGVSGGNPMLSPSQLGYSGGLMGMFKGNGSEEKKFTAEPPRESLVEPPAGYQTPSPNYAYGTGPDNSRRTYFDVMSGKEKEQ